MLFVSYSIDAPTMSIAQSLGDYVLDVRTPQSSDDIKAMRNEIGRRYAETHNLMGSTAEEIPLYVTILFWKKL